MVGFLNKLKQAKQLKLLTNQQYKTIKGQWNSGDLEGAKKGFYKLLKNSL